MPFNYCLSDQYPELVRKTKEVHRNLISSKNPDLLNLFEDLYWILTCNNLNNLSKQDKAKMGESFFEELNKHYKPYEKSKADTNAAVIYLFRITLLDCIFERIGKIQKKLPERFIEIFLSCHEQVTKDYEDKISKLKLRGNFGSNVVACLTFCVAHMQQFMFPSRACITLIFGKKMS